jgi:transposase
LVIDAASRMLVSRELPNSEDGFRQLVRLFDTHQVLRVGIEGSGSFGRAVAVHLALCWQIERNVTVVEVPTLMTSRERRGQLGKGKTDPVDALAIARITAREHSCLGPADRRRRRGPARPARLPRRPDRGAERPSEPGPR